MYVFIFFFTAICPCGLTRIDPLAVLAAGIVASLLNIILPREMEDMVGDDESQGEAEEEEHVGSSTGKVEV